MPEVPGGGAQAPRRKSGKHLIQLIIGGCGHLHVVADHFRVVLQGVDGRDKPHLADEQVLDRGAPKEELGWPIPPILRNIALELLLIPIPLLILQHELQRREVFGALDPVLGVMVGKKPLIVVRNLGQCSNGCMPCAPEPSLILPFLGDPDLPITLLQTAGLVIAHRRIAVVVYIEEGSIGQMGRKGAALLVDRVPELQPGLPEDTTRILTPKDGHEHLGIVRLFISPFGRASRLEVLGKL